MIGKIEGVSIELRGTRQYGRAIHCQGADRERFKVEHLPVGSQMFFTVADGDAELAMWVQTGKLLEGMQLELTEWFLRPEECADLGCKRSGECHGHVRMVRVLYEQTPAGWMWNFLQKHTTVKTVRLVYAGVQLGIHVRSNWPKG